MKTFMKTFKVVSLLLMTLALANCAKSGGGSNNNNNNNGYVWQNGQCYQNVNGQMYPTNNPSLCNNVNNGNNYVWQNGQCYQNVNGQMYPTNNPALCNGNTGTVGQTCSGIYYGYSNGQLIPVLCTPGMTGSGHNAQGTFMMDCRGLILATQPYSTSSTVSCQ